MELVQSPKGHLLAIARLRPGQSYTLKSVHELPLRPEARHLFKVQRLTPKRDQHASPGIRVERVA